MLAVQVWMILQPSACVYTSKTVQPMGLGMYSLCMRTSGQQRLVPMCTSVEQDAGSLLHELRCQMFHIPPPQYSTGRGYEHYRHRETLAQSKDVSCPKSSATSRTKGKRHFFHLQRSHYFHGNLSCMSKLMCEYAIFPFVLCLAYLHRRFFKCT